MDVATAVTARDRARKDVRQTEGEISRVENEIARFTAKDAIDAKDFVAHENNQRRLPRLRADLEESQAALVAAESALVVAVREHDLAALADGRTKLASLLQKPNATISTLADDERPVGASCWAFVHDGAAEKDLRAGVVAVQEHLARWNATETPTIPDAERVLDAGPWRSFDATATATGSDFYYAICGLVNGVLDEREAARRAAEWEEQRIENERAEAERAERERKERERAEHDRKMREPQWHSATGWYFSEDQVRYCKRHARDVVERAEKLAKEARADPERFNALHNHESRALVAAFDPEVGAAIDRARHGFRGFHEPAPPTSVPAHQHFNRKLTAAEQDARDLGTRIEMDHQNAELMED